MEMIQLHISTRKITYHHIKFIILQLSQTKIKRIVEILTNNMTAISSKEMQKSFEIKSGIETPDFVNAKETTSKSSQNQRIRDNRINRNSNKVSNLDSRSFKTALKLIVSNLNS